MKEYCTLVTSQLSDPHSGNIFSSRGWKNHPLNGANTEPSDGQLQQLIRAGWEVIDASSVPKLSTYNDDLRFAFILEREIPQN